MQTRLFRFGGAPAAQGAPAKQGAKGGRASRPRNGSWRRRRPRRRAARIDEVGDHAAAAGIPAQERRAVQRQHGVHRVLGPPHARPTAISISSTPTSSTTPSTCRLHGSRRSTSRRNRTAASGIHRPATRDSSLKRSLMSANGFRRIVTLLCALLAVSVPASAQIELTGSYVPRMLRGLHRARPRLGPRRLHRHAAQRRGARQGAALHVEPAVDDRAPVPRRRRPGSACIARSACGSGARSTGTSDVIAWKMEGDYLRDTHHDLDGRTARAVAECALIPPPASRPANGKATR